MNKGRKWVVAAHGWAGFTSLVFTFLISVSGLLLVYFGDLIELEYPGLLTEHESLQAAPFDPDYDRLFRQAYEVYPDFEVLGVLAPASRLPVEQTILFGRNKAPYGSAQFLALIFDPETEIYKGSLDLRASLNNLLLHFHGSFLLGKVGGIVAAVLGLVWVFLALSSLWMWWPGLSRFFRKATRFRVRGSLTAVLFSLHFFTGFWMGLIVLIWGLTGAQDARPDWFSLLAIEADDHLSEVDEQKYSKVCGPSRSVKEIADAARSLFPNRHLTTIRLPDADHPNIYTVTSRGDKDTSGQEGDAIAWLHASCQEVVLSHVWGAEDIREEIGLLSMAIHSGRLFGSFRVFIGSLVGVALLFLSISGCYIWLKQRSKRAR